MPKLIIAVLICVLGGASIAAAQLPRELASETRNIAKSAPDIIRAPARSGGAAASARAGKPEAVAPADEPALRNSGRLSRAGGLPPDTVAARPGHAGAAAAAAPDARLMRASRASIDDPARTALISVTMPEAKHGRSEPPSHIRAGRTAAKGRR